MPIMPTPKLLFKRKNVRLHENTSNLRKLNKSILRLKTQLLDLLGNKTLELPLHTITSSTTTPFTSTTNSDMTTSSLKTTELTESKDETGLTEMLDVWQNIVLICIAAFLVLFVIVCMFIGTVRWCLNRVRRSAEAHALIQSIVRKNQRYK